MITARLGLVVGAGVVSMAGLGYALVPRHEAPEQRVAAAALFRPSSVPVPEASAAQPTVHDHGTLIYDLQKHLKRVGCYRGTVNGVWTAQTRGAMVAFNDKVNARLPTDVPDDTLLSLVSGHKGNVCDPYVPSAAAFVAAPGVNAMLVPKPKSAEGANITPPSYFPKPNLPMPDRAGFDIVTAEISGGDGRPGPEESAVRRLDAASSATPRAAEAAPTLRAPPPEDVGVARAGAPAPQVTEKRVFVQSVGSVEPAEADSSDEKYVAQPARSQPKKVKKRRTAYKKKYKQPKFVKSIIRELSSLF